MSIRRKILIAAMSAGLALCGVASASANTWQDNHPRRVEVNTRLERQDVRVDRDLRDGRITARQAADLHARDRMIRMHERKLAALHGGHLTRIEQMRLNQQENRNSRDIYRNAH